MRSTLIAVSLVAMLASGGAAFYLAQPKPPFKPSASNQNWEVQVLDGETKQTKSTLKHFRFEDDTHVCNVFIQQSRETWVPTASCTRK